jgi:hypothetical protein
MNSFLQLHDEDVNYFVQNHQDGVRRQVESRVRAVHFVGDIIELFFPRLSDTVTVLMGGDIIDPEDMYLTLEDDDPDPTTPPPGPSGDEGNDIIR